MLKRGKGVNYKKNSNYIMFNTTRKLHRKYERKYNCERMHQSLNNLTPMDYYYTHEEKVA